MATKDKAELQRLLEGFQMTEQKAALFAAFNRGWTGAPTPTLERLRADWSKATDAERAAFRAEIEVEASH
jgi:hypothetical protein